MLKAVWSLIKRCWLPLLLTCALLTAVDQAVDAVVYAVEARMIASVEALKPDGPTINELVIYELPVPETYTVDEYILQWDAYQAAVKTHNQRIRLLAWVSRLPSILLSPVVLLGLYRLLLAAWREEAWRVSRAFSGFWHGGHRAIWLGLLVLLRYLGFALLWAVPAGILGNVLYAIDLGRLGEILLALSIIPLALWLAFRYLTAPLHLADDRVSMRAGDCIQYAVQEDKPLLFTNLIVTLWPMLVCIVVEVVLALLLPAGWGRAAVLAALETFDFFLLHTGLTVIYLDLRAAEAAMSPAQPSEGFLRARALSQAE